MTEALQKKVDFAIKLLRLIPQEDGPIEDGDGEYDSYESALSAGIAAALELIEKEGE